MLQVIAWLLLWSPWPAPHWLVDAPCVYNAVEKEAIREDLFDGEYRYAYAVQHEGSSLHGDWYLYFRQCKEDLKDAPESYWLFAFPNRDQARKDLGAACEWQYYCKDQAELYKYWPERSQQWQDAAEQACLIYQIYDRLTDAQIQSSSVKSRRLRLKNLRDLLGDYNFRAGRLPAPTGVYGR